MSYSHGKNQPLQLYVESGHSSTHVIPILNNNIIQSGVKRLDVGGKLLTKLLIQTLSIKQVKLHDYFISSEQIKESMCSISQDFKHDMSLPQYPTLYYSLLDPDIKRKG